MVSARLISNVVPRRFRLGQFFCHRQNARLGHFALERTAKCCRDRHLSGATGGLRRGDDGLGRFDRSVAGLILVGDGKSIGGHGDRAQLVDPARAKRPFGAALVHHQPDIADIIAVGQAGAHRIGIGHLRHCAGIDETGDLDPPRTGRNGVRDQCQLVLGRNDHLFVLQPVTGRDLKDFNLICIH